MLNGQLPFVLFQLRLKLQLLKGKSMRRLLTVLILALAVGGGIAPAYACSSSDGCDKPSCSDTNSC
jgi:hypothetical protein